MPRGTPRGNHAGRPVRCMHATDHLGARPSSTGCAPCRERGDGWAELWVCLTCGWVACSGGSPNQHARAHYEETDHPVAVRLPPASRLQWCHVHRCAV
jgi:uncharacterized UBP type Zn finger protein